MILTGFLILSLPLQGQDVKVVRDLHLWTGVQIEKELARDWTVSLGEEIRFKHDISEINNYLTEAGLRYRITRDFALEGQYRYTRDKKKDQSYENLSRYALDLRYTGRLDPVSLRYRLRYQKEVEGFKFFDQQVPYEKYLRHRLIVRYEDLGRFKPFVSSEVFQVFRKGEDARYEYIRILGGLRYRLGKAGEIDGAYGFNRELGGAQPAMIYTLKVQYTYKF
jgi:hypothetical protein